MIGAKEVLLQSYGLKHTLFFLICIPSDRMLYTLYIIQLRSDYNNTDL